MHIKRMHTMIEDLTAYAECAVESGVGNGNVNLCDIGQIIDMIKDLASAEYHARLAKCLEKDEEEEKEADKYILMLFKSQYGDDEGKRYYDDWRYKSSGRFAPRGKGERYPRRGYEEPPYYHAMPEYRMSVDDFKSNSAEQLRDLDRSSGKLYYTETMRNDREMDNMRDRREGKSGQSRRTYMETKEMHKGDTPEGKQSRMRELDIYMNELNDDMKELIRDMSPEEKTMLKQKIAKLATLV